MSGSRPRIIRRVYPSGGVAPLGLGKRDGARKIQVICDSK